MEEGDSGKIPIEEEIPPPPEDFTEVKVKVIKPFKPSPRVTRFVGQGKCFYHPTKPASFICSSCGKSVCSLCAKNLGGVYFCPQCAPFETPKPPPPSQEAVTDTGWYRALLSIGIILVIIGAILAVAYWPLTTMNAAEFESLMEEYRKDPDGLGPETGGHNFKDYRPGDVIVIRDKIERREMEHDPTYGVVTRLWFESTGKDDLDFSMLFDADLERDYHVGDTVSITLHVDEDTRTHDEVIREYNNDLPNISNIDHTTSVDIVFFALIIFGVILVLIYILFTQKAKSAEPTESSGSMEGGGEERTTDEKRWF